MNVRELKEKLEQYNDEDEVVGAWDGSYSIIHSVDLDDSKNLVVLDVETWGSWED